MLVAVSLISTSQCTDQHRVLFVSLQPLQAQSKNSQECEWQDWSKKVPSLLHTLSPPCDFPLTTLRLVQFKLYSEFKFNLNPNSIFSFSSPFFLFTFQTYHKLFLNLTDSLRDFSVLSVLSEEMPGFLCPSLSWSPSNSPNPLLEPYNSLSSFHKNGSLYKRKHTYSGQLCGIPGYLTELPVQDIIHPIQFNNLVYFSNACV